MYEDICILMITKITGINNPYIKQPLNVFNLWYTEPDFSEKKLLHNLKKRRKNTSGRVIFRGAGGDDNLAINLNIVNHCLKKHNRNPMYYTCFLMHHVLLSTVIFCSINFEFAWMPLTQKWMSSAEKFIFFFVINFCSFSEIRRNLLLPLRCFQWAIVYFF